LSLQKGCMRFSFQCRFARTALTSCPRHNTFICLNPCCVHQLAYCPCNMRSLRTHEGVCTRSTFPQHVPLSVSTFQLLRQISFSQTERKILLSGADPWGGSKSSSRTFRKHKEAVPSARCYATHYLLQISINLQWSIVNL